MCDHNTTLAQPVREDGSVLMLCEECGEHTDTYRKCTLCVSGMVPQPTTHFHPLRYRRWRACPDCSGIGLVD